MAHDNAKFNYSGQYFMFGPPSHAFDSFPVVCLILVFLKISLNFVVKYSVGVRYISCSWWNNAPTLATLSFRQPRQDFAAIPVRPWIRLFLLRYLFSYFVKFHFCFELTYISIWEAFLNSERAFFGCSGRFLACGVLSHFTKSIYTPISIKVALGIVLWSLKAIVWWSRNQRIALYCVFQWPNPKATLIEIGVY